MLNPYLCIISVPAEIALMSILSYEKDYSMLCLFYLVYPQADPGPLQTQ